MPTFEKVEAPTTPDIASAPAEMYKIPGFGEPNIKRYLKCKDEDPKIEAAIEQADTDTLTQFYDFFGEEIPNYKPSPETKNWIDVYSMSQEEKFRTIIEQLDSKDRTIQLEAATLGASKFIEKEEKRKEILEKIDSTIETNLTNENQEKRKQAIELIRFSTEEKREQFVSQALMDENIEIFSTAAELVTEEQTENLQVITDRVEQLLRTEDIEEKLKAIELIPLVKGRELELLNTSFEHENPKIREKVLITAGKLIRKYSKSDKYITHERSNINNGVGNLIEKGLEDKEKSVNTTAARNIQFLHGYPAKKCFNKAIEEGHSSEVIESPLYIKYPDLNTEEFSIKRFEKDGSETFLLGGSLKDKLIVRRMEPKQFQIWQKLFEDSKTWKEKGFDYVPIEPIQGYRLNTRKKVDTFSAVLDVSIRSWDRMSGGKFQNELKLQKETIEQTLQEMGITHGHLHGDNFCLKFYRDKNGNPDLNRTPKIFLIDFDQAIQENS